MHCSDLLKHSMLEFLEITQPKFLFIEQLENISDIIFEEIRMGIDKLANGAI